MNDIYFKFWIVDNVLWFWGLFCKKWSVGFLDYIYCMVDVMIVFFNFGMYKIVRINWRKNFVVLLSFKSCFFLLKCIDWNCLMLVNDGVKS